ncbi:uncharacterized protein LOC119402200 isoform X2 [Rhipicephalus sanguineus]|nr:uncharacterized protein LOC119402200 isoform X2 [Rhipicephalus sanguineus]XP_037525253.1 uncharacterized protein LOC119402200 isoform X2 [Rhipicephalus sanguineus]
MMYSVLEVHQNFIIVGMSLCLEVDDAVTAAQNGKADSEEVLPIVTVFNTTQRLWLYWKNYTDNNIEFEESQESTLPDYDPTQKCTFIKKYNISDRDIYFWWATMMGDDMVRNDCYGNFSSEAGESLGSMDSWVLYEGETSPFQKMRLMYMEKNCSVFFVTYLDDDADAVCELYVRNKAISQGPSKNCTKYYDDYCKNKTVVYNSTCPTEVAKGVQDINKWNIGQ